MILNIQSFKQNTIKLACERQTFLLAHRPAERHFARRDVFPPREPSLYERGETSAVRRLQLNWSKQKKQILLDICIFPFKCNEVLSGK